MYLTGYTPINMRYGIAFPVTPKPNVITKKGAASRGPFDSVTSF